MRIAMLVGDPEMTDIVCVDNVPWKKKIKKSHLINGDIRGWLLKENDGRIKMDKRLPGKYVKMYHAVYYYMDHNYPNHKFTLLEPNQMTRSNMIKNDIVFTQFFDYISIFSADNKLSPSQKVSKANLFAKILHSLPPAKLFPPLPFIDLFLDKCKYYSYLQKKKIKVPPFFCINKKQWLSASNKKTFLKFTKTFIKPVLGTSGLQTLLLSKSNNSSEKKLAEFVNETFAEKYPKIVFQKFIPQFETSTPQIRCFFIGDKYQYSIVSKVPKAPKSYGNNTHFRYASAVASVKSEGGNYPVSSKIISFCKTEAKKVLKAIDPFFKGEKLVTRVDFGCCLNGAYFVNEVEYCPGFFTNWLPSNKKDIYKRIGDQMINISLSKK
jgi:hypothetical protein